MQIVSTFGDLVESIIATTTGNTRRPAVKMINDSVESAHIFLTNDLTTSATKSRIAVGMTKPSAISRDDFMPYRGDANVAIKLGHAF
jgi:hypothetical protein